MTEEILALNFYLLGCKVVPGQQTEIQEGRAYCWTQTKAWRGSWEAAWLRFACGTWAIDAVSISMGYIWERWEQATLFLGSGSLWTKRLCENLHQKSATQRMCCLDIGWEQVSIFNLDVAQVSMAILVLGAKIAPFHSTMLQSSSTQEHWRFLFSW